MLRDSLGLTGTKFGCGVGVCGACTVLENGNAVRSCQIPASDATGRSFVTIEGLSKDANHPCQRAWMEEDVAQCGFCQPGMILTACALLRATSEAYGRDDRQRHVRFCLPLRNLPAHAQSHPSRERAHARESEMKTSRRTFLKTAALGGAALVIGFDGKRLLHGEGTTAIADFQPNGWIRIDAKGAVTLTLGKSEMGQGVRTSLPMILADELGADWSHVTIVQAMPGPNFKRLGTGGSGSVQGSWKPLRDAAAAAREMLTNAAATNWKVDAATCVVKNGAVMHPASGRRLPFGELVGRGLQVTGPAKSATEEIGRFSTDRPSHFAHRGARCCFWQNEIRHRHAFARDALRVDRASAFTRSEAAKVG